MSSEITRNDLVESLVAKIQGELFDEKSHKFPEFPLKADWSAIVWNEWFSETSDLDDSDEGNDIISPEHFKAFANAVSKRSGSLQCWLIDTEPFVNSDGEFIERNFTSIDLNWNSFNNFHKLFDLPPSRFYLVDETLTWFLQVDESVLIAGDQEFMSVFVKNLGGYEVVLNNLNDYAEEGVSVQTKEWVSKITNRFTQAMKEIDLKIKEVGDT
jgi:hypothetical protein